MGFLEKLNSYAQLIVCHGLNLQKGQIVNISAEVVHRDFAYLVAKTAYEHGARFVNLDLLEPRLARTRLLVAAEEDLSYVPPYVGVKYRDLVDQTAANLKIVGAEDPDLLSDLEPKRVNTVRVHQFLAVKYFYDEGIGKSLVHWTVAAAATPKWAKKVFPALEAETACAKLWDEIFRITRADQQNALELWRVHNQTLQRRAKKLTEMRIKEIHFTGPETDLIVGLSPRAVFKGGGDLSPRGVEFEPNIPTEEVFTTPDWRMTRGKVRATRPFFINGKLICDLRLEFCEGELTTFSAAEGEETFAEYVSSDPGAKRLGEVALVGIDSPVYQSGLVFEEILFDENAACHIAVGSAYKFCLENGALLSDKERQAIGCNESTVHTDMMISSEQVDVTAITYSGETVPLLVRGSWVSGV